MHLDLHRRTFLIVTSYSQGWWWWPCHRPWHLVLVAVVVTVG